MKTPLALEGARLAGGDVIRRAKLRGVESNGMLCSARELGLSDEHEGILELPDELVTGTPLRDALALDDTILTLNVTPNRGDVLSVLGVAREVAAIVARKLTPPALEPVAPATRERFPVRLEAPAACPRFAGRVIQGVNPAARTPLWMRERLRRAGLRPIRPVVDVTNYVMLELGQPLHAYDLRRLTGHIEVRMARAGETLHAARRAGARARCRKRSSSPTRPARSGSRASWAGRRAASRWTRRTCSSKARSFRRTRWRASRAATAS